VRNRLAIFVDFCLEAVTAALSAKETPERSCAGVEVGGEKPSDETKKASRDAGPFALHSA
jgi:hypothetical protein